MGNRLATRMHLAVTRRASYLLLVSRRALEHRAPEIEIKRCCYLTDTHGQPAR